MVNINKFYGRSLPRPRIYTEMKRLDPPTPVLDPLLSWADQAPWSMGGLKSKRLRLNGQIQGNLAKLREERESSVENTETETETEHWPSPLPSSSPSPLRPSPSLSPSPPPAPLVIKRRRRLLVCEDDDDESSQGGEGESAKTVPARKLWDEFEAVAEESGFKKEAARSKEARTTRVSARLPKRVSL